ncbi:flagellar basal body-associated FliL family protein [Roseibium sp. RKSG952]|uniref:flagellar basal body-associated FliL family protein n=1 Tax=Roseibium sp. RKSG952 TaxID=2529384 RepID=UPI0012BCBECA|nr:flagellar basal body-associated FliL family protein [Roseibium sp. RKSG952]MTH97625.1 flagellar basal body-associated protein FliL [Roseibium sp. RKSG952]
MANDTAADGDVDAGAEAKATAKSRSRRLVLFSLFGALFLILIAGTAYYILYAEDGPALMRDTSVTVAGGGGFQRPVVFFDLPEMTVNLATEGRTTYLRVRIALEVENRAMIEQIQPFMPRILDAFQIYLRELRPADLEGSAGLFRLKEELLRRINLAVYPARVEGVLFKEILVQ